MNSKDLLERKAISSEPFPGSLDMFLPSYNFSWTFSEMTGRDRGKEAVQQCAWLVMNSVECENTFRLLKTSVML